MARNRLFGSSLSRLFIAISLTLCWNATAQTAINTEQTIFNPSFRSLQVYNPDSPLSTRVISLNGNDRLIVSFDEMGEEKSNLKYSLVHCNADWQPSGLVESDYIDGFNEARIDDYAYSQATLSHYVNYRIEIGDILKPKKSGNYLLIVKEEDYPNTPVLQIRFSVSENSISIGLDIDARTDIDYLQSHQQLGIEINALNSEIDNLYTDLTVTVAQNELPGTSITLNYPSKVEGRKAVFDHRPELIFNAGNEYRRMEIVETKYPGMGVDNIRMTDSGYMATLKTDLPRASNSYVYDETQHGRFTIREYNSDESDTESEYIDVVFTLAMPEMEGCDLFIEGELTGRKLDDNSKMDYDSQSGSYHKILNLKQGAYNYRYVFAPENKPSEIKNIDGDKYQTGNEYTVMVYYRKPGELYDRLAGVSTVRFH